MYGRVLGSYLETPYIFPPYTEYPTIHFYDGPFSGSGSKIFLYGWNTYSVKRILDPETPYISTVQHCIMYGGVQGRHWMELFDYQTNEMIGVGLSTN